jgi:hypothetical protein
VHLFEEDSAEGAVFVPEDSDVPLSRRARERLALEPDGRATIFRPGPADRPVATPARWERIDDGVRIRPAGGGALRVRHLSADRWLITSEAD